MFFRVLSYTIAWVLILVILSIYIAIPFIGFRLTDNIGIGLVVSCIWIVSLAGLITGLIKFNNSKSTDSFIDRFLNFDL